MPGVSKEQIAAAKQMTAIEFLRRFRPHELVRSCLLYTSDAADE